jgi:hypothetical protein
MPALSACRSVLAPELATALDERHASRDTAVMRQVFRIAYYVSDPVLFDAALKLADDESAPREARTAGLLTAARQQNWSIHFGGITGFSRWFSPHPGGECGTRYGSEGRQWVANPLPENSKARLRTVIGRIAASPSAPLALKQLASCMQRAFPEPEPPRVWVAVHSGDLTVVSECPNEFSLSNHTDHAIRLSYREPESEQPIEIEVKAQSEFMLDLSGGVPLDLYVLGVLVSSTPSSTRDCT